MLCLAYLQNYISGVVQTYPEICENAIFFLRIWLASTRIQRIFQRYPEIFENALQSENFFIQYEYVYVWTVVSGNFRIRFRHSLGSSLHGEHYKQTWHPTLSVSNWTCQKPLLVSTTLKTFALDNSGNKSSITSSR